VRIRDATPTDRKTNGPRRVQCLPTAVLANGTLAVRSSRDFGVSRFKGSSQKLDGYLVKLDDYLVL
jgi:hypothetical protein